MVVGGKGKQTSTAAKASSNWQALQKKLSAKGKASIVKRKQTETNEIDGRPRKRPRTSDEPAPISSSEEFVRGSSQGNVQETSQRRSSVSLGKRKADASDSVESLRRMIIGQLEYDEEQRQPGKFVAIDCEMVGVGVDGSESSLARVSVVNFYGAVLLDEFVRQRERVVDYRTEFSGVRERDMIKALPFPEVQERVANLLKDRVLVGHAVFNDLKALLLSHPRNAIRDTQQCAGRHKLMKTRYPALRKLVQQELGTTIQSGEHSSVTDARATMALYRLHRKEWDKDFKSTYSNVDGSARKMEGKLDADMDSTKPSEGPKKRQKERSFPGGGRKGVSSGLSTILKRTTGGGTTAPRSVSSGTKWWQTL
ncbi:ribonuclease H-like protein [Schizopora paradoxa]|uniref:RNA exonuclease 4 n=1 Tax=Schizopora paradoxa TaxID=27342 RepID=A0A0H2R239_9AGAM|nr:ribonuclease H-like protein [Schizopora paradoxa]